MTRIISAPSGIRTGDGEIGRACQHIAALAIAITAALAMVIGYCLPAQAVEGRPASTTVSAQVRAAETRAGAVITTTAVTTGDGTGTATGPRPLTPDDPRVIAASSTSAGWDKHGPWVDISKEGWPIITAIAGAGAVARFCLIAKIGPFLCLIGVGLIAAVTEWVKHHRPCPGNQKFRFYLGNTPSYCHG